jgi:hypothetical protein
MKKLVWLAVAVVVIVVVILLATSSKGRGRGADEGVQLDLGQTTNLEDIARNARLATDDASLAGIKAELMRLPMVDQGKVVSVEDSPDGGLVVKVDVSLNPVRPVPDVTLEISRAKMPAERPTVGQMISFTGRITDIQTEPTIKVTVQNPTVGPAK